jgi:hypothetical protein
MKVQISTLSKLQNIIFQACILVLNKEVGLFCYSWVYFEKELIVYEVLNRVFIVIFHEVGIDKSEIKHLIPEKVVYHLGGFTSHSRGYTRRIVCVIGSVLAFPKFDLYIVHFISVEVPENVIIIVDQAGIVVYAIFSDLKCVHLPEICTSTFRKIQICSILNTFPILNSLSNVLDRKKPNSGI